MTNSAPLTASAWNNRIQRMGMAMLVLCALTMLAMQPTQAQTYTILHNFTNGADGAIPSAGLTMDRVGNLYGTVAYGGNPSCDLGCGTVFKLEHKQSGWTFTPIYAFAGPDGAYPSARVILGPDGTLYGTTYSGGASGFGSVFRLQPPASFCRSISCSWTETVLYSFQGGGDGGNPLYGDLVFDAAGNLYGTTCGQSNHNVGTVFELSPSNGGWNEKILWTYQGNNNGPGPCAGVIFDSAGNLYGTTVTGGTGNQGTIYELTPSALGWSQRTLHSLTGGDGRDATGGLIFDSLGNLYGSTSAGGDNGGGTVYELMPSNGGWTFNVLYNFNGTTGSVATLSFDASGNLYGSTYRDGAFDGGSVFNLMRSGGGWTYTDLHDFQQGTGGVNPIGGVTVAPNGNFYGTTSAGGAYGDGVVWEITR